jgi:hypothetical protein
MFCQNCRKPIRLGNPPYCNCRFYSNARQVSYILIKTLNRKILVKEQLWVIAQNGSVALINNHIEITLIKTTTTKIHVTVDGERLGVAEYVSLPPFVEKLLYAREVRRERRVVTVIATRQEAMTILSSTSAASLRAVENGRATIAIPI